MDTYKDAVLLNDLWARGRRAVEGRAAPHALAPRRSSPAPTGCSAPWLTRGAARRAATRVVVLRRDARPRSRARLLEGIEARVNVVARRRRATRALIDARARRVRGRHRLPPRRPDDRRDGATARPLATFETNVRGTWTLLEACRRARRRARRRRGLRQGLRPAATTLPYTRGHAAAAALSPTTSSKAATDLIARSYWHTYGLPVAVTRFANLYGGGDLNRSRLIPEAVAAALAGRAPVDPLRRHARARLPLRRGRGRGLPARSPTPLDGDGAAAGEAFNAGGGRADARARRRRR